eukprot:5837039-Amphidinium_carterae.2
MMKMIRRLSLNTLFETEMSVMKHKFSQLLVEVRGVVMMGDSGLELERRREHIAASKTSIRAEPWLKAFEGLWQLILPVDEVKVLRELPEEATWSSMKKELYTVVGSSELGWRLWAFALKDL